MNMELCPGKLVELCGKERGYWDIKNSERRTSGREKQVSDRGASWQRHGWALVSVVVTTVGATGSVPP